MTIDKNFKRLVRAHAEKTGKAYRAALADFESPLPRLSAQSGSAPSSAANGVPPFQELLATPFCVAAGRLPATAGSADLATAQAHARDLAINPRYFAENGTIETIITKDQVDELILAGAADDATTQVIRSFRNDQQTTFSDTCRRCRRWIWCGDAEREAACACGQAYRVAFDLADIYHWTKPQGNRCLDCGAAFQLTSPAENRNPWKIVNAWQWRCHNCSTRHRSLGVLCDFEVSARVGAVGTFQVIALEEDGEDVTHLVDQGIHFFGLEQLRQHLERETGNSIDIAEIEQLE